jgi:peroxiredoxin
MARQLGPGDPFPKYTISTASGPTLNLPGDLTGEYAVVLFYRGIW